MLPEVRDEVLIVFNIDFELGQTGRQFRRCRRVRLDQIQFHQQVGLPLQGLSDVAVPEQMLHAFQSSGYRYAGFGCASNLWVIGAFPFFWPII